MQACIHASSDRCSWVFSRDIADPVATKLINFVQISVAVMPRQHDVFNQSYMACGTPKLLDLASCRGGEKEKNM